MEVGYASGETVYKYSFDLVSMGVAPVERRGRIFDLLEPLSTDDEAVVTVSVGANAARFTVRIWDRFGDPVRVLVDEANPAPGERELRWDRTNDAGAAVGPGYYIWRATVDGRSESRLVRLS